MPYYLFRISEPDRLKIVKQLDLVDTFEKFREARNAARQLRAETADDEAVYKVMFAESRLAAEEQLQEKRQKPVLMEHER
jgi:hypothetical protein